jgi:hypothetical protein
VRDFRREILVPLPVVKISSESPEVSFLGRDEIELLFQDEMDTGVDARGMIMASPACAKFHDHFLFSLQQTLFKLRQEDKKMTMTKRRMVRNAGRAIRREIVLASLLSFFSGMVADQRVTPLYNLRGGEGKTSYVNAK